MTVLFAQSWDVVPGKFEEYSAFVSGEYIPGLKNLGLTVLGGYYVAVGEGPRIIGVAVVDEPHRLTEILAAKEYRLLSEKLKSLTMRYGSRLWVSSGRLREGPYRIQTGAWKFNQYYNILPGKEDEHYQFVKNECMPGMKELGAPITEGWRLAVGSGPQTLAECTAKNLTDIAKAIDSDEFRRLVRKLKKEFVTDYSSRILAPTGRIEVPAMVGEMMKGF
jgi:hypothetical protein